jgi:hypothetical protein
MQSHTTGFRFWALFFVFLLGLFAPLPAKAQFCLEYVGIFFDDDADDCSYRPSNDRTHFPGVLPWAGQHFLYHSTGNDLEFLSLSDPAAPSYVERSSWHNSIGNQGDNDYGLEAIALCADCRFGVAYYRLGTVYFDLGSGSSPDISDAFIELDASGAEGFTFKHDGQQFLVAAPIVFGPCPDAGLYLFQSVQVRDEDPIQCLDAPAGNENFNLVDGGRYLRHPNLNGGNAYLWTVRQEQVATWEISGTGQDTRLHFVGQIEDMWAAARGNNYLGFDVDLERNLAVSFNRWGFVTWQVDDLAAPAKIAVHDATDVYGTQVALNYPLAFTSGAGQNSGMSWNVSDPAAPQLLEPDFWSTAHSWNQHECDLSDNGAVFGPDGHYLYASRLTLGDTFDVQACVAQYTPEPPPDAAVAPDTGPDPDAVTPPPDAALPDAALAPDGGSPNTGSANSGCGCRGAPARSGSLFWLFLVFAGLWLSRRAP